MFKVIKNMPMPDKLSRSAKIYPFDQMEVGDCFTAPKDMGRNAAGACRRTASITSSSKNWSAANNPSAKFSVRSIDDKTAGCWRVA